MKKKGFTIVPNSLILDNRICNNSKLLYIYIKSLSENYRTLRNSNICSKIGVSVNTLQSCKAELIKYGYLKIYRRKSANYYFITNGTTNVNKVKTT